MADRTEVTVPALKFPEGPRWHDGALWFSDQLGGAVRRLVGDPADSRVEIVTEISRPSGLGFLPDGSALVTSMDACQVLRIDAGGAVSVHADLTAYGKHLNDMYVDARGRAYVDAYGDDWNAGDLVLVQPDGTVTGPAASGLAFPNGIDTPDGGATLLVAETFAACISAFDVADDGSLSGRRVWASLPDKLPDGLCVDGDGSVWVASYATGEFLHVREGGEVVDRIAVEGRWAMACALGGPGGRTLFLCSAETDQERYFAGDAVGHLETVELS
jgi:sugar lactone lactonase YvrE